MLLTTAANTWGVTNGADTQRTDLWRLNMAPAVRYLASLSESTFTSVGLDKANLPSVELVPFYATKIDLPVQKVLMRKITQGTIPRNMPGYFDALDTARIDFIHDTAGSGSAIYTILHMWRALVRTGRVGQGTEPGMLLPNSSFKPRFKFDICVELLNGVFANLDPYEQDFAQALAELPFDARSGLGSEMTGYSEGAKYTLVGCWPRTIQQATIDRGQRAQVHIITAQFQPQEISA